MIDGVDGEVHIQIGPVQVVRAGSLNVRELPDSRVTEPRELFEGYKPFSLAEPQPKAVGRHVRDFNGRSAYSMLRGFHRDAPE
jgi:hypothetical protein